MIDDTRIGVALWVISTIIITLNTLSLARNMSISARRSLWNVQIVVARSLLKRRYSVWQCGGLTPNFVRGKIFIIFAFNFIFWAQISIDACGKEAPSSSPALTANWICSRLSRVQILDHACK